MANRRMFSKGVIDTDPFLELPTTSQLLYFHLGLHADDDGFIASPKKITRVAGLNDNDMQTLVDNNFIIEFSNGVCVIRHWKLHNSIQKDRYTPTIYQQEFATLIISDNGIYEVRE